MEVGVSNFKYMRQTLYQTDDYWPVVRRNIVHARLVLGEGGGTAETVRGGTQGVRNVIQGSGTSGTSICI